jgi:hypothetical protein
MYFTILIFISACATYRTFNQSTMGVVRFPGGTKGRESWDDSLIFKRASWYHGMNLYYDALIYPASLESPFSKWFSDSEKDFFNKCKQLLVTINYSSDPSKISHVMFRDQMYKNGYDEVVLNSFSSYIKVHPTFQSWNLQNYKIMGFCHRQNQLDNLTKLDLAFPSFKGLSLKLI